MKFRATVTKVERLRDIVKTLEVAYRLNLPEAEKRQRTMCNLELTGSGQIFLSNREKGMSACEIWCTIQTDSMFSQFQIQSLNNNRIFLSIDLSLFGRALQGDHGAATVIFRLTKKDGKPAFAVESRTAFPAPLTVRHDIPVHLIPTPEAQELTEPDLPMPKIQVSLPPMKVISGVLDRFRATSDVCTLTADMGGEVTMALSSDKLSAFMTFKDLDIPQIVNGPPIQRDRSVKASVSVDVKKLSVFLACNHLQHYNLCYLCIVETGNSRLLLIRVILDEKYNEITFYVPVLSEG